METMETTETTDRKYVRLRLSDEVAHREFERLIEHTPGLALQAGPETPCDLLVCEITKENEKQDFDLVNAMVTRNRTRHVFLVSRTIDQNLVKQALRLGVRDFFPLPVSTDDVQHALLNFRNEIDTGDARSPGEPEKQGTILHFVGSKGGVGTTTVAVNLAASLAASPKRPEVALVDMNVLFGDVPVFLGIESYNFDWTKIIDNITRLDRSFLAATIHKHRSGLNVLPPPASIVGPIPTDPEIMAKLFRVMRTMFDYVVVDGGQGLGGMSKDILRQADQVFIVALLSLPCLINVKRLREAFDQLGYPPDSRVEIIANRVFRKSAAIPVEDAERSLKKKILWTLPNDYRSATAAINAGKTFGECAASSDINRRICELAEHLQKSPAKESRKKNVFERVFSR